MSLTDIGGVLGAFCSHAYPHATSDASILLPRGLKSADLVFYSALHALGVEVDVLPVMLGHGYKNTKDDWWDSDEGNEPDHDTNSDDDDEDSDNDRKKRRRKNKKNQDSNGPLEYLDPGKKVRVGKCLNSYVAAEMYEEEPFSEVSPPCPVHSIYTHKMLVHMNIWRGFFPYLLHFPISIPLLTNLVFHLQ